LGHALTRDMHARVYAYVCIYTYVCMHAFFFCVSADFSSFVWSSWPSVDFVVLYLFSSLCIFMLLNGFFGSSLSLNFVFIHFFLISASSSFVFGYYDFSSLFLRSWKSSSCLSNLIMDLGGRL
jgi:hypothetical protein